ncbi:FIG00928269: hypothetical protein, partial [hydrothermal vent metagenome]
VGTGPTTGVVVSEDGYIISSAFNFASKPASILVELPGRKRLAAKLIATDRSKMLTLLKIDAKNLIPIKPASQKSFQVGQWTIAVGRTFEENVPSMSVGILSAVDRIWGKAIQTDCKVSPVNYGGPLLDINGNAMGILVPLSARKQGATAGVEWYDSGIGFAVPMEDIYASLKRLKTGKDLHRGLMGLVRFQSRDALGGKPVLGVIRVESPAEIAGFKKGDLILKLGGKKVFRQADVRHVLGRKYAGDEIEMTVSRKGKQITKKMVLVDVIRPFEAGFLGILPMREGNTNSTSVGVRFVYPNSPAEKAGLKVKDRITTFNGTKIVDTTQLSQMVNKLSPEQKVTLVYRRGKSEKTIELKLGHISNEIPVDLRPVILPLSEDEEKKDAKAPVTNTPKTGRFTAKLPNGEHSYWVFVPDFYNPNYKYTMMVWIHPTNDTMEAAMIKKWKTLCRKKGIIIIAPRATKLSRWPSTDAGFVKEAVEEMKEKYSIDSKRIFLHGYASGGAFAYHLAFKYRDLFRGVCVVDSPITERLLENDSDLPLQFYILTNGKLAQPNRNQIIRMLMGLKRMKYPVIDESFNDRETAYPSDDAVGRMAVWADSLDKI